MIAVDVTDRQRAEERLRENEERYRLLFERNLAGVFRSRPDGRVLEVNDAVARIFGYEREELLKDSAYSLYFSREERQRLMARLREQKSLSNIEVRMRRRDGTPVWVLENMTLLETADGGIIEGTIIDITDRKAAQEQVEYQAYHDVLTGLPNRLLFRDRIGVALAHARRSRRAVAVMFLDLDQFKLVNDTLGHTVGDGLLQAAAERLVHCVRGDDTVARMGGDEFTILLSDLSDTRAAATVAQKVLDSISHPIEVDGHELFITTSIGISIFPDDGMDAEMLLKNADRAMYRAKEAGRNNYQFATRVAVEAAAARRRLRALKAVPRHRTPKAVESRATMRAGVFLMLFAMTATPVDWSQVAPDLEQRLIRYKPVEMPFTYEGFNARERRLINELVAASRDLEDIYWRQNSPEDIPIYKALVGRNDERERALRRYLWINGSRYDQIDETSRSSEGNRCRRVATSILMG